MAAYQYVYTCTACPRPIPVARKVFENIHLNFLPGVKIGVVGVNGAGKSTLMKIMAGLDKDFRAKHGPPKAPGGLSAAGTQAGRNLDVRDNVMLGVAEKKAILDRYNELAMNYSDETADEMAHLQDEIDAQNLWDLDAQIDVSMEALALPAGRRDDTDLSGGEARRVALCKLLLEAPDMLLAGRTDQPPGRGNHRLAATAPH